MPLESANPKGRHWERTSLPVIGSLAPGVYSNPTITVDEFGRITTAMTGGPASGVGAQDSGVPVPGGPFNVLNFAGTNTTAVSGGGGVLTISVATVGAVNALDEGVAVPGGPFSTLNFLGASIVATNGGGGQLNVNIVGTTPSNVQYVKGLVGILASQNVGAPVPSSALVRTTSITIITPYSPGAVVEVQDAGGAILLPAGLINPQVLGTYQLETPGNIAPISNTQVVVIVTGAPVAGAAVVDMIYETP